MRRDKFGSLKKNNHNEPHSMKLPGINKGQKGNHALYSAKNSLFEDSGISEAR